MKISLIFGIAHLSVSFVFKELFIGYDSVNNFWIDSILFLEPLSKDHPPFWFLILTPILVILSIPIAYYLFVKNKNLPEQIVKIGWQRNKSHLNRLVADDLSCVLLCENGLFC